MWNRQQSKEKYTLQIIESRTFYLLLSATKIYIVFRIETIVISSHWCSFISIWWLPLVWYSSWVARIRFGFSQGISRNQGYYLRHGPTAQPLQNQFDIQYKKCLQFVFILFRTHRAIQLHIITSLKLSLVHIWSAFIWAKLTGRLNSPLQNIGKNPRWKLKGKTDSMRNGVFNHKQENDHYFAEMCVFKLERYNFGTI